MSTFEPNFDRVARLYRWIEYLVMGTALENCRNHFLPHLLDRHHALVLGDGDGRFTSKLLAANPDIAIDAVDISSGMLHLLRKRCQAAAPGCSTRLRTHRANVLAFPFDASKSYDLVVTHFFLDCLTQNELDSLISRVAPTLTPGALWLISDFRIPSGPLRLPAKLLVSTLYLGFRVLTGLRTTQLPDHATPLAQASLARIQHQLRLAQILTAEIWRA
jgi:ubiquinone/menaquinone biosynthesis C-methylase UbiE